MSKDKSHDLDAGFALQLEQLHDALRRDRHHIGEVSEDQQTNADIRLQQAREALLLIEQVKKDQSDSLAAPIANRETQRLLDTPIEPWSGSMQQIEFENQRIGRFELTELIGQGGYGMVFRARDLDIDRDVALKIPRLRIIDSPEVMTRFVREGKAAGCLSHPNIVTVFEVGRDQDVFYIASEMIEGVSLAQWMSETDQLPTPTQTARLISQLSEAMQHAHSRGVTHRDLKPANILLESTASSDQEEKGSGTFCRNGPQGASHKRYLTPFPTPTILDHPRIADFGLAKLDQEVSEATQSGMLIGTPAYMSPEQTFGTHKNVGAPADIYALGAVMYELLTGRKPFSSNNMLELVKQIQVSEPTAPTKINSSIPIDLQAICLKCLEKKPNSRYPSAFALADDLDRWAQGKTVTARNTTRVERAWRWCRNNPGVATSLVTTALILVAATAISTTLWISSSNSNRLANAKSQEAGRQSQRLRRAVNDLLTAFAEEPRIKGSGLESFRASLLTSANQLYQELRSEHPTDEDVLLEYVDTVDRIAQVYANLGNIRDVQPMIEETQSLIETQLPGETGLLANMKRYRALIAKDRGDLENQIKFLQQATQLRRLQFEGDPNDLDTMDYLRDLQNLGFALLRKMDIDSSKHVIDEAIAVLALWIPDQKHEIQKQLLFGKLTSTAARIAGRENHFDVAKKWALQAIESLRDVDNFSVGDRSEALVALGMAYFEMSRICKASKDGEGYKENSNLAKSMFDQLVDDYPENPRYLVMKFSQQLIAIRTLPNSTPIAEKIAMCQSSIAEVDLAIEKFPSMSFDLSGQKSNFLDNMASFHLRNKDYEASFVAAKNAVGIRRLRWEAGDRMDFQKMAALAAGLQQLGSAYRSLGETEKCYDTMAEAIQLSRTAYEQDRSVELRDLLIKIYVPFIQFLAEDKEFEKCLDECPQLLNIAGDEHLGTMLTMAKLGVERIYLESLWQTGRYEQGRLELDRQFNRVDVENKSGHASMLPFLLAGTILKSATAAASSTEHDPADVILLNDAALDLIRREPELAQWQRDQIANNPEFKILGEDLIQELLDPKPVD